MSRSKAHQQTGHAVTGLRRLARRAAARLQPAADQVIPLARDAGAAATRQADRTRSWAAPQVERAGHVVQDSIAPKVWSLLSAAARRLEPGGLRRPRWPRLVGASAATAAVSAAAAAGGVRGHLEAAAAAVPDQAEAGGTAPATQTAPAPDTGNGQRSTSSDASQNSDART